MTNDLFIQSFFTYTRVTVDVKETTMKFNYQEMISGVVLSSGKSATMTKINKRLSKYCCFCEV